MSDGLKGQELSMSNLPKHKHDNNQSGSGRSYKKHKGILSNVLFPFFSINLKY